MEKEKESSSLEMAKQQRRRQQQQPTADDDSCPASSQNGRRKRVRRRAPAATSEQQQQQHPLVQSLRRIDPVLQFLCKATGHILVDGALLCKSLPVPVRLTDVQALADYGVLRVMRKEQDEPHGDASSTLDNNKDTNTNADDESFENHKIGFPPPPLTAEATTTSSQRWGHEQDDTKTTGTPKPSMMQLHGSTKKGAQQRLRWLQKQLSQDEKKQASTTKADDEPVSAKRRAVENASSSSSSSCSLISATRKAAMVTPPQTAAHSAPSSPRTEVIAMREKESVDSNADDERNALQDLKRLLRWCDDDTAPDIDDHTGSPSRNTKITNDNVKNHKGSVIPTGILPRQVSFAASQAAQPAVYDTLPSDVSVPPAVRQALAQDKPLYRHQVQAVTAALRHKHVSLTTGTGSGKSLAFLFPVIATLVQEDRTALLLFPTKALAQDQLGKLQALAARLSGSDDAFHNKLRPATLDGDTLHSQRRAIAESANLILTNPDTLHAAILPHWEKTYAGMLANLAFVVVDEAHSYQGIFGAHVSLILARLRRVCAVARAQFRDDEEEEEHGNVVPLRFIAASATLPWPEIHVRKLCPIGASETVTIIDHDTSPRAAKHFFVWNPPLLSAQGVSSSSVTMPKKNRNSSTVASSTATASKKDKNDNHHQIADGKMKAVANSKHGRRHQEPEWHRRHSADETALLLARAVSQGVRCMAFAKTRNLVEWIFERTIATLKSDPTTAHLADKVESYRGGYTRAERRKIEERLFRNELLGVVGTNALELGVDVGGVDVTLHCGYPSSHASLLQQAGRAGRGRSKAVSCAIVVCFNSPAEQHLWRYPATLLSKGVTPTDTIPLNKSTVQSHILCASSEFPVTGSLPAECIVSERSGTKYAMSDWELLGGEKLYEDALEELKAANSCISEVVCIPSNPELTLYKAHPSMKKAWSLVAIRSIEPVNYSIVDLNHPGQGGRTDGIYNEEAVLDTLPYSRVFYHAHPGAIITHRGTRYKVVSMTRPPEAMSDASFRFRRSTQLSAFARPTSARYSTRPLSTMHITIVKQFEGVELTSVISQDLSADGGHASRNEATPNSTETRELRSETEMLVEECQQNGDITTPSKDERASDVKDQETYVTSFSGCGVVNVKRSVHGYKKLSLITRTEFSRSELSLPDMEFETFGIWFDTEPHVLTAFLGSKYGEGVHALSHALLAVAPLFEPGLIRDDFECDHSYFSPTRLVLFDERAGGSGSCERLWRHFFVPENNIMDAALDLLSNCESCIGDEGYEGGCPACLHASQCIKFNMNLSRSAAIAVGKRMLERIKSTDLYKRNEKIWLETKKPPPSPSRNLTPRRKARYNALKKAKEMRPAQNRQYVVGRPSFVRTEGGNCEQHQEYE